MSNFWNDLHFHLCVCVVIDFAIGSHFTFVDLYTVCHSINRFACCYYKCQHNSDWSWVTKAKTNHFLVCFSCFQWIDRYRFARKGQLNSDTLDGVRCRLPYSEQIHTHTHTQWFNQNIFAIVVDVAAVVPTQYTSFIYIFLHAIHSLFVRHFLIPSYRFRHTDTEIVRNWLIISFVYFRFRIFCGFLVVAHQLLSVLLLSFIVRRSQTSRVWFIYHLEMYADYDSLVVESFDICSASSRCRCWGNSCFLQDFNISFHLRWAGTIELGILIRIWFMFPQFAN